MSKGFSVLSLTDKWAAKAPDILIGTFILFQIVCK